MRDTHFSLKLQLFKGRLFDAFKKEQAKSEDDSDEESQTYLTYVKQSTTFTILQLWNLF